MENNLDFKLAEGSPDKSEGFSDKLIWLLKGFVYPLWNRPYYKEAASRCLIKYSGEVIFVISKIPVL